MTRGRGDSPRRNRNKYWSDIFSPCLALLGQTERKRWREAEITKKRTKWFKERTECVIKQVVSIRPNLKQCEKEQTAPLFKAMADKTEPPVWNQCCRLNKMFWEMAGEMANQQEGEQLALAFPPFRPRCCYVSGGIERRQQLNTVFVGGQGWTWISDGLGMTVRGNPSSSFWVVPHLRDRCFTHAYSRGGRCCCFPASGVFKQSDTASAEVTNTPNIFSTLLLCWIPMTWHMFMRVRLPCLMWLTFQSTALQRYGKENKETEERWQSRARLPEEEGWSRFMSSRVTLYLTDQYKNTGRILMGSIINVQFRF